MKLQLEVVILAENGDELLDDAARLLHVAPHDSLRQFAAQAGRATDNPVVIEAQQLLVDPGTVVEPLGKGIRHDFGKIVVPLQILGQQNQVVAPVVLTALVEAAASGHVDLAAENRLDPLLFGRVVKLLDPVHIAVVGDRQRGHAELLGTLEQRLDSRRAVQNRILRMYMKMSELPHCFPLLCLDTKVTKNKRKYRARKVHFINNISYIVSGKGPKSGIRIRAVPDRTNPQYAKPWTTRNYRF